MGENKHKEEPTPPPPGGIERGIKELIQIEWSIMDELQKKAKECAEERHRAQHYLALSSHARTLAWLIQAAGIKTGDAQDLAVMLKEIAKKAKKFWKEPSKP